MESGVALAFGILLAVFSLPLLAMASNGLTGSLGFLALSELRRGVHPAEAEEPDGDGGGRHPRLPSAADGLDRRDRTDRRRRPAAVRNPLRLADAALPAIALFRKEEYRNAGYMALPLVSGDDATRIWMLIWTVLLVALSVLLVPFGIAGPLYLVVALALGGTFLVLVARGVLRHEQKAWARKTFLFSLVYLAGLFAALLLSARAH
jgi:protoheme IX farnesyltransferase